MHEKSPISSRFCIPLEIDIAPAQHAFEKPEEKNHGTQSDGY
jgi:hypothetical protein